MFERKKFEKLCSEPLIYEKQVTLANNKTLATVGMPIQSDWLAVALYTEKPTYLPPKHNNSSQNKPYTHQIPPSECMLLQK